MTKIQNLTGHYTITGLEKVRTLVAELEQALNEIKVNVVWSDTGE